MRKGGGKAKGSAFERKIAQSLSLWLTRGKDKRQLIRSVLSGGWKGGRGRTGWRQAGDLAPNGPIGERFRERFAVECKHRRQINPLTLWQQSTKGDLLPKWWARLRKDSRAAGVAPMLVFRSNGFPIMVMMLEKDVPSGTNYAYFSFLDACIFPFETLTNLDPARFLDSE